MRAEHGPVARWLHWGFILLFVYGLSKQLDELEELEAPGLLEQEMLFAGVFLLVVIARFLYMRFTVPSVVPSDAPLYQRRLASAVHLGMYAGLVAIPASGLWIGALYGDGVREGAMMEAALLLHEIAVNGTYTLSVGHVAAALYHRRLRDGIWDAMVPFWRESGS